MFNGLRDLHSSAKLPERTLSVGINIPAGSTCRVEKNTEKPSTCVKDPFIPTQVERFFDVLTRGELTVSGLWEPCDAERVDWRRFLTQASISLKLRWNHGIMRLGACKSNLVKCIWEIPDKWSSSRMSSHMALNALRKSAFSFFLDGNVGNLVQME